MPSTQDGHYPSTSSSLSRNSEPEFQNSRWVHNQQRWTNSRALTSQELNVIIALA